MRQATRGQGGPARAPSTFTALDRELLDLERRKMCELRNGRITLTAAGYREIARRFPRQVLRGRS